MYTRLCAWLSKLSLALAVAGLIAIVLAVQWQVFGRYVLNDTPTWAEALALVLVLFVTAFGLAVGVRDAGHIGLESLVALLPPIWQRRIELVIHTLVGVFGAFMTHGPARNGARKNPCCRCPKASTSCRWSLPAC
jgi:TRAP-type transport system small permease protein